MSVHELVAQFLRNNKYTNTLKQFEQEYGKPIPISELPESLEEIVKDRKTFKELHDQTEGLTLDDWTGHSLAKSLVEWTGGYPSDSLTVPGLDDLVIASAYDSSTGLLFLSTNKLTIEVVDVRTGKVVSSHAQVIGRVVVKNLVIIADQTIVFAGMDGKFHLFRYSHEKEVKFENVSTLQAHRRLVVEVKSIKFHGKVYVVSLGWDFTLKVFEVVDGTTFSPVADLKFTGQGTCFDVVEYLDEFVIVLGKHETTLLEVIRVDISQHKLVPLYKISLNDAEFTSSGFSPMAISISQGVPNGNVPLIAIGTSHEPFMRLILVSLAEYSKDMPTDINSGSIYRNQILKNLNTLSPQDKYSQAIVSFRGSGVWIMGDDGIVRGLDLKSGQVVAQLKGHSGKIKHLLNLSIDSKETLVSCGTDKEVRIWQ